MGWLEGKEEGRKYNRFFFFVHNSPFSSYTTATSSMWKTAARKAPPSRSPKAVR